MKNSTDTIAKPTKPTFAPTESPIETTEEGNPEHDLQAGYGADPIPESQGDMADRAELEIENEISGRIQDIRRQVRK